MNPNYAKAIKEDLEKLLKADFIEPVDQATWLSPIVVVPKKNGKLRKCIDFRRLNVATKKDPYPLPFTDEVLNTVIGYAAYSFIDYFSGYHQVHTHENDRYKTAFITEWGTYIWVVMPFGLKNAPLIYQKIVNQIFKYYLNDFMKLFLDDFSVYCDIATHLPKLHLVFECCRLYDVSLNPDKCIFYVPSGVILGYIICQAGKFPDPKKIEALVNMPPPKNIKAIHAFNGLAQFSRCFIKDYASIMSKTYYPAYKERRSFWLDYRVRKCLPIYQDTVPVQCSNPHWSQLEIGVSGPYRCIRYHGWCHAGTKPYQKNRSTDSLRIAIAQQSGKELYHYRERGPSVGLCGEQVPPLPTQ